MLNQYDIDILMQRLQAGEEVFVYYVAHMIEPREGLIDEHIYKSSSKFKVIKVKLNDIKSAYFEYLNYVNNPSDYHVETEESYYDHLTKHTHFYIVPNSIGPYENSFNPKPPSIIYGVHREVLDSINHVFKEVTDISPIRPEYTNVLEYGDMTSTEVNSAFDDGKLDWKYRKLQNPENVDGIDYHYITSDWYILDTNEFLKTEMPLININKFSSYFTDLTKAFDYIDQLMA